MGAGNSSKDAATKNTQNPESGKEMWDSNSEFSKALKEKDNETSKVKILPAPVKPDKPTRPAASRGVKRVPTHRDDGEHLDLEALKDSLLACGRDVNLATQILHTYDHDNSGGISLNEFEEWISHNNDHPEDEEYSSSDDGLGEELAKMRQHSKEVHSHLEGHRRKKVVLTSLMKKKRDQARAKIAKAKTLQNIDGFALLSSESIDQILSELYFEIHPRGTVLAKQGDEKSDVLYFIVEGECDVVVNGQAVAKLNDLQFFGEGIVYHNKEVRKRTADVVVASVEVQVLVLERSIFRGLCRKGIISKQCQEQLELIGKNRKDETARFISGD